ncbi:MAG TPA: hypothetical protein VMG82_18525 [Candidatus Sulfotelmatobacter sp.]|nr:hypothetical protein [Candidatus Sulfotelmatobacter sp.]
MLRRTDSNPPAIVCDAEKLSQVAIIQELGRNGIPVIALASTPSAFGFASRYVCQRIVSPVASHDPEYIGFLQSSVPRGVLFYSNDANTENIADSREMLLNAGFSLLISDRGTLERVINKYRLYLTARESGISVPQCAFVSSVHEAREKVEEFGVPVILKATNLAGGVYRLIESTVSVDAAFREMSETIASEDHRHRSAQLMVQRWISQAGAKLWNFSACVKAGEIVSFSMGQRIRSDLYPDGRLGSILLFGKTAYNKHIHELNTRLFRHIRFDGIVETEWSEHCGGEYDAFLYDFNPRPSGNIRWSFKSGVSLALQYYKLALGLTPEPQTMRHGTLYAKIFYRWSDPIEALNNSRLTFREKAAILKDDLVAMMCCRRHAVDILDVADPGPTIRATAELSRNLLGRLQRRLKRYTWTPFAPKLKHASR